MLESDPLASGKSNIAPSREFSITRDGEVNILTLASHDGMNRLTRGKVAALLCELQNLACDESAALVITGEGNFSAGADLNEIRALTGPAALEFSLLGQSLMN